MAAPFPLMNGTLAGQDVTYFFVYANQVTGGLFVPVSYFAFFILVFVGSLLAQFRFSTRIRPETSFAAASFAALIYGLVLSQKNGLLNPIYIIITIGMLVISMIWLMLGDQQ